MNGYPRDYVACGGAPRDDMQPTDSAAAAAEGIQPVAAHFPPFQPLRKGEFALVAAKPNGGHSKVSLLAGLDLAALDFTKLEAHIHEQMQEAMRPIIKQLLEEEVRTFLYGTGPKPRGILK